MNPRQRTHKRAMEGSVSTWKEAGPSAQRPARTRTALLTVPALSATATNTAAVTATSRKAPGKYDMLHANALTN